MKIKSLGIFDSGLGGYSVYHDLVNNGPHIQYILYADQKNAPYGNKSPEAIYTHAKEAMQWFSDKDICHVLLACNTVSAVALDQLKLDFPELTIWGIIDLTLSQIKNDNASISVVSTQATYQSHAYQAKWGRTENVMEYPLVELVAMIEENSKDELMDEYLKQELKEVAVSDYLILACTHFPLVDQLFKTYISAEILDSRKPIRELVTSISGLNDAESKIYTSGAPEVLKKQIKNLFNTDEKIRRVL